MCQFLQVRKCNCAFCIPNVFSSSAFASALFHYHPVFMTHVLQSLLHLHPHTRSHYKQPAALAPMVPHPLYTHYHFCTRIHIKCNAFMFSEVFVHVYILVPIHSLTHLFIHSFVRSSFHSYEAKPLCSQSFKRSDILIPSFAHFATSTFSV